MFNFDVRIVNDETVSELHSDDVLYVTYLKCTNYTDHFRSQIVSYIVHPVRGGIIRKDFSTLYSSLFHWGDYSVVYAGAK